MVAARWVLLASLVGGGGRARADSSVPAGRASEEVTIGGLVVDLDAAKVARRATAPARCNVDDGPYMREHKAGRDRVQNPLGGDGKLALIQATARHRVAITPPESFSTAFVLDRAGRDLLEADAPGAVVEDARGGFAGYVHLDWVRRRLRYFDAAHRARWERADPGAHHGDVGAAVLVGDLLVVARYSRIASGARLAAFDLAGGTPRWTADVEQLHIAHSQYLNDVTLDVRGGRLVLRGYEMGGCYLQIFDAATGKRVLSTLSAKP